MRGSVSERPLSSRRGRVSFTLGGEVDPRAAHEQIAHGGIEPSMGPYAPPRVVTDLADCAFYHTMDVPGYGLVHGEWDLRRRANDYLGNIELDGKRVLEVGTASGFLCFYMESQGADVVAYDLNHEHLWDLVPFARGNYEELVEKRRAHLTKINNGWWLNHRIRKSKAKMVYGTVYEIPEEIGPVDITTFGAVLVHVRDPFLALSRALSLTRETAVVTERLSRRYSLPQILLGKMKPTMAFLPNAKRCEPTEAWWLLTPDLVKSMMGVLGFERTQVTYHFQRYNGRRHPFYTVVGRRTRLPGRDLGTW